MIKIICVVGARPNFVKIAPIIEEIKKYEILEYILVHTGQHHGFNMSDSFFQDLDVPEPDAHLALKNDTPLQRISEIVRLFENICLKHNPDYVLVVGDVDSTLACSIVASRLGIKIIHVEAGLRSFDRSMPEETNRVIIDQLSTLLFTSEKDAEENLIREGVDKKKICFMGNVMIDSLIKSLKKCEESDVIKKLGLLPGEYSILTLHRPSNVDNKETLENILKVVSEIADRISVVFPLHPRTKKSIVSFRLSGYLLKLKVSKPLGYLDFLNLLKNSRFILTDSGGIQEESTFLKIPCLTLRNNTERPVTVKVGSNILVGADGEKIKTLVNNILSGRFKKCGIPQLWDGQTAERIIKSILNKEEKKQKC